MPYKNKGKQREYNRKYQKDYYKRHRDYYISRAEERHKRIAIWLQEYKRGLKCEICGEGHVECLDFHHKDPKEKEFSISRMSYDGYSVERIKKEIEKCMIICKNCHAKIHAKEADVVKALV